MFAKIKVDIFEVEFNKQRVFKLTENPLPETVEARYGNIVNNVPTASALEVKVHAVEDNLVIISKEEDLQEGDHVFIKYLVND